MSKLAILILAAGESRRLGQAKQLLEFNGETLLDRAVRVANTMPVDVHAVIGAYADKILTSVDLSSVELHVNPRWQDGMGSSISFGISAIAPLYDAVLIMLCDQPLIPSEHYLELFQSWQSNHTAAATEYPSGHIGVPAIFTTNQFKQLQQLEGDQGAKTIINEISKLTTLYCREAQYDIDTHEDIASLR